MKKFKKELKILINKYNIESKCYTLDFLLV